jgi:hypothetical protein
MRALTDDQKIQMFDVWVTFASGMIGYLETYLFPEAEIEAWDKTARVVTFQILRIFFSNNPELPRILKEAEEEWRDLVMRRAHKGVVHHLNDREPGVEGALKRFSQAINIKGGKKAN